MIPPDQQNHTTTLTAMRARPYRVASAHLERLAVSNALATVELIRSVAREPVAKRVLRLGSGLWPLSDHPEYSGYVRDSSSAILRRAGRLAALHDVRLSFHPGQFCALASLDSGVVQNSIEILEEHARQAELVGATNINIHLWGRGGVRAFRAHLGYLSERVRSRLTVENDEFGVGVSALLEADLGVPLVLDPHHHWINSGQWPGLELMQAFRDTWPLGRHPKMHLSWPRNDDSVSGWPVLAGSRTLARAHHDMLPNLEVNAAYLEWADRLGLDILVEAKSKDIARDLLYRQGLEMRLESWRPRADGIDAT